MNDYERWVIATYSLGVLEAPIQLLEEDGLDEVTLLVRLLLDGRC